jgi:hypothetical protein
MSMLAAAATVITLTVRVYDYYGVPTAERHRAVAIASETLAQAGVATVWIDCSRRDGEAPEACRQSLGEHEIVLRFERETKRGPHILGTAVVQNTGPNVVASVYAHSSWARSAKTGVAWSTILGRVTAHEIGHLLLGSNSHAPTGLMKATWHLRDPHPDEWQFTDADAEKIRMRVIANVEASVAQAMATSF